VTPERLPNSLYRRGQRLDNGLWELRSWLSDDLPDGTEVDEPRDGWIPAWTMSATHLGLIRVGDVALSPDSDVNVWFVFVDEPKANPPAANLVAFVGDERPMGTIVSRYTFATMGVQNDRQVGAIRWYPRDGLIHQIYVGPDWRRNKMAMYIMYSASAFHHANGWAGILHGDGRRTLLGDYLAAASAHPHRYLPLQDEMPPMDAPSADAPGTDDAPSTENSEPSEP
jgi:hypothetical protein